MGYAQLHKVRRKTRRRLRHLPERDGGRAADGERGGSGGGGFASELYFLRARYYDPVVGRFISRDPIAFAQRYAYAGNNPVRFVDPSGLTTQEGSNSGRAFRFGACAPDDPLCRRDGGGGGQLDPLCSQGFKKAPHDPECLSTEQLRNDPAHRPLRLPRDDQGITLLDVTGITFLVTRSLDCYAFGIVQAGTIVVIIGGTVPNPATPALAPFVLGAITVQLATVESFATACFP